MHKETTDLKLRKTTGKLPVIVLLCFLLVLLPFKVLAQEATGGPVQLLQPKNGAEIISKKPLIRCSISEPFQKEYLFVYLDGIDVTGILDVEANGFSFRPVQVLMSGQHQLTIILYTNDGQEMQQAFVFSNRHSETFEDMVSVNELSTRYEGRIDKSEETLPIPDNRIDANLASSSLVRNGQWNFTLDTNVRYYDQEIPVEQPLEKGVFINNYLLALEKTKTDTSHLRLEIGDVQINESTSTLQGFARRGGKLSLTWKAFTLDSFLVKSDPVFNVKSKDDTGLNDSDEDHLKGVSGTFSLVEDKMKLKILHITGGSTGVGQGLYTEGGGDEGDVTGGVLQTDFFSQKFVTEMEFYESSYDGDTTDSAAAEDDKAYRISARGSQGKYNYQFAYEYFGLYYNIPGHAINNDRKGFSMSGSRAGETNDITLGASRHRSNVDDDMMQPDVYTTIGNLNYNWRKYPKFPIGFNYSKTLLESSDEPSGITPTDIETDTAALSLMYLKDSLNLTLQPAYSVQNNRLSDEDSTNTSLAMTINYLRGSHALSSAFTFNRTELDASGEETDNYLVNLQLQGRAYKDLLGYGLVGSYNLVETNNGFKTETYMADGEVAYSITGNKIVNLLNPTIGIRSTYHRTEDHLLNTDIEDWVILLVLTSTVPFTF